MNTRQLQLQRIKKNFTEKLNGLTVFDYFKLPNNKITLVENGEKYILTFRCEKAYFIPLNLPFELNCIVLSYLYELSITNFSITIPHQYPYEPTIWKIEKSSKNVPEQYIRAVRFQNSRYRSSWSTGISLERDIQHDRGNDFNLSF